jgi:hypothetical protein
MKIMGRFVMMLSVVLGLSALPGCGESEDAIAVRETWDKINEAYDRRDADYVLAHMAEADFEYYDRLLHVARKGTRAEIERLPPNERATVVSMRHRVDAADIKKMDARGWMRFLVSEGFLVDDPDFVDIDISKIKLSADGQWASANLVEEGVQTHYRVNFHKSGTEWLLNTTGFEDYFDNSIRDLAEENGGSVDAYIMLWETMSSGRRVRVDIYDRPT